MGRADVLIAGDREGHPHARAALQEQDHCGCGLASAGHSLSAELHTREEDTVRHSPETRPLHASSELLFVSPSGVLYLANTSDSGASQSVTEHPYPV